MNNPSSIFKKDISPLFIGLIIIAFSIFAFAIINLSLLPTPEEKQKEFEQQMNNAILAEEAQATGKTIEELKGQKKHALSQQEIVHNINQAVLKSDIKLLKELLSKLNTPLKNSTALVSAVNAKNTDAFSLLLAANFPCNNDTDVGSRAFAASISTESHEFLRLLIKNDCHYIEQKNQKSLGERIAKSSSPAKIFLLPELNLIEKFGDKALQHAIRRKREKQALTMIELGANTNIKDILELSIRSRSPMVALALIKNGAILKDQKTKGQGHHFSALLETIRRGYVDVSKEILARDPDYITRNTLEDSVYSASLSIRNQEIRRKSIYLALKYGVKPETLRDKGSHGLIKAIFYQDELIVEQLLKAGVNPNLPDGLNLALIVAKNFHDPRYKQSRKIHRNTQGVSPEAEKRIISLLEQYGAIDNFLKAVMLASGIKTIETCRLANKPKIVLEQPNIYAPQTVLRSNYTQCVITTNACLNQGFGSDDCMRSIPSCDSEDKTAFCCDDVIKKQYFVGRCSGLLVRENMTWLKLEFDH